jgi:hypothetical protein
LCQVVIALFGGKWQVNEIGKIFAQAWVTS